MRDFWASAPAKVTAESKANDDTVLELERRQIDFDFADDDLLTPQAVIGGLIHAGKMSYSTLVMSPARMLPDSTAEAVARFVRTGGTLIAAGALPETGPVARQTFLQHLGNHAFQDGRAAARGEGWSPFPSSRWPRASDRQLSLSPPTDALRVTERHLPSGRCT